MVATTARRGGKLTAASQYVCSVAKVGNEVTISTDADNKWTVISIQYPTITLERNGRRLTVEAHRIRGIFN